MCMRFDLDPRIRSSSSTDDGNGAHSTTNKRKPSLHTPSGRSVSGLSSRDLASSAAKLAMATSAAREAKPLPRGSWSRVCGRGGVVVSLRGRLARCVSSTSSQESSRCASAPPPEPTAVNSGSGIYGGWFALCGQMRCSHVRCMSLSTAVGPWEAPARCTAEKSNVTLSERAMVALC